MATPRDLARIRTLEEIRRLAWEHLETQGAAALSLRAIARDLGVVSSAIYRYVPSRDDLLTMLITEGYADLADTVQSAEAACAREDVRGRWIALSTAVRGWALARPAAWALLYGSPVPGYAAPAEQTTPEGVRVVALIARLVTDAAGADQLTPRLRFPDIPAGLAAGLSAAGRELGAGEDPELAALTVWTWTSLLGAVSSEVFGQLGRDPFGAPEELARLQLGVVGDALGLGAAPA